MNSALLWWPGAPYATHEVAAGLAHGLAALGVRVEHYATNAHIEASGRYLDLLWRECGKPEAKPNDADVLYHAAVGVLERAHRTAVEWVVIVSGMYQHPDVVLWLRRAGFKVALVCTESPYDMAGELSLSRLVNHVFTNERTTAAMFATTCRSVSVLRHAWHPEAHTPDLGADVQDVPEHDVVFVGTGFIERVRMLEAVNWDGIDLGLYGNWTLVPARSRLRKHIRGREIRNQAVAGLYRRAKVGINLHRTSQRYSKDTLHVARAESLNPRAYELAACGLFFVSDYRAEVPEVFGNTVPTFRTGAELEHLLRSWVAATPATRLQRAGEIRQAVAQEHWVTRAQQLVSELTMSPQRAAA
ncbi:Glycosyl transferases group 1 [uncultured Caudovirales phage]|uniref:Glycosyl transferases group 1 n=1 Tax=uncultured Caudovirales phage TaxID=2100421 RepID=A0A6J5SG36_9CAUD|nr:Glycosyl transferases group 1 [uncultured Caudovirales phage]CAB4199382.1 Glycosyl transferases group 1 [uncultured Caudovirales phage]CAB4212900.1 Glycosyl transferases group 1 [uncultured Caudovirales phage]CAB5227994.1 Glycosyl transferases group 1 [uncultured Caudovirales phage]